ncbi:MAG TPA: type II secretion system F family protein [Streptosporangiaceae bacterium]
MSGTVLIAAAAGALGLAIAMMVLAIGSSQAKQGGVAGALAAIEQTYTQRVEIAGAQRDPFAQLPGWLRVLALRLSPSGFSATLQRRLDLAGNPPRWSPDRILAVKGLGLVGLALLGVLYGLHSFGILILCVVLGGAIGFFLPDLLLYNAGTKRQAKIRSALPDALDMLTICVEAGLGFDAALSQVARNSGGPLAAEFARVLQEMQIGKSRSDALRAMVERTTVTELRAFVSALVQAGELGIAVARVLREQAKEMRLRRRQRAEEQAQKVPVKILFPLIACLFPALMVIIIGPGGISIAHSLFGK